MQTQTYQAPKTQTIEARKLTRGQTVVAPSGVVVGRVQRVRNLGDRVEVIFAGDITVTVVPATAATLVR